MFALVDAPRPDLVDLDARLHTYLSVYAVLQKNRGGGVEDRSLPHCCNCDCNRNSWKGTEDPQLGGQGGQFDDQNSGTSAAPEDVVEVTEEKREAP